MSLDNLKAWYTQPYYSLEDVLLIASVMQDQEALRYYDEQTKKIAGQKEKKNVKANSGS